MEASSRELEIAVDYWELKKKKDYWELKQDAGFYLVWGPSYHLQQWFQEVLALGAFVWE